MAENPTYLIEFIEVDGSNEKRKTIAKPNIASTIKAVNDFIGDNHNRFAYITNKGRTFALYYYCVDRKTVAIRIIPPTVRKEQIDNARRAAATNGVSAGEFNSGRTTA